MVQIYHTATEFLANSLTFARGSVLDVVSVGVYHTLNPTFVPQQSDFVLVDLVKPGDALAEGNIVDVLSLVGPGAGSDVTLAAGDWQRWVMVKTATETIIRKVDVVSVL